MPHKDRTARLNYLAAWKLAGRPSPATEAQSDPTLPPRGRMVFSADGSQVQCHCCGRWFGALNTHLRMHGLDAATYKEAYGIGRTHSLLPPAVQDRYRAATIARDQGHKYRDGLPSRPGRPVGLDQRLAVRVTASIDRKK